MVKIRDCYKVVVVIFCALLSGCKKDTTEEELVIKVCDDYILQDVGPYKSITYCEELLIRDSVYHCYKIEPVLIYDRDTVLTSQCSHLVDSINMVYSLDTLYYSSIEQYNNHYFFLKYNDKPIRYNISSSVIDNLQPCQEKSLYEDVVEFFPTIRILIININTLTYRVIEDRDGLYDNILYVKMSQDYIHNNPE